MSEGQPAPRRVRCPYCGAKAYVPCQRMIADSYHQEREAAAREAKPAALRRAQALRDAAARMFRP